MKFLRMGARFQLNVVGLIILLVGTVLMGQQRPGSSQPIQTTPQIVQQDAVVDSLQNERITELRTRADRTDETLAALAKQQNDTQRSVTMIVGLGVGFGSALTILQGMSVILQWRVKSKQ